MVRFDIDFLPEYTDDAIIDEIRRVAKLVDGPFLSKIDFTKFSKVGLTTIRRRIGNWETALNAAGIGHRYSGKPVTERMRDQVKRNLSDTELLDEIRRIAGLLGQSYLSRSQFSQYSSVSDYTIIRRFKSWNEAIRKVGFSPQGYQYTINICYRNMFDVWTHYGRCPQYLEMGKLPSKVGGKAYVLRWGSWRKALKAFVNWVNSHESDEVSETEDDLLFEPLEIEATEIKPSTSSHDRRDIGMGLRFRVMLRDNFKCVLCGRSPATEIGVILHVDHIHPFSKGGKTVIENLQTLCIECNLGKRNKILQTD